MPIFMSTNQFALHMLVLFELIRTLEGDMTMAKAAVKAKATKIVAAIATKKIAAPIAAKKTAPSAAKKTISKAAARKAPVKKAGLKTTARKKAA
jgi:hypothetical protein